MDSNDRRGVSLGRWARLAPNYYQDERVMGLTPTAEVLYIRGLALCAGLLSDGHVARTQLALVTHDMRRRIDVVRHLERVGLWIPDADSDGWTIRNYLKWNRSRSDIAAAYARDRARKTGRRPSTATTDSVRNTSAPFRTDGVRTETDTDTDTEGPVRSPSGPDRTGPANVASPPSPPIDFSELRAKLVRDARKSRDRMRWGSATSSQPSTNAAS